MFSQSNDNKQEVLHSLHTPQVKRLSAETAKLADIAQCNEALMATSETFT